MRKPKFQNPSGMHDILPEEQKYFQKIYNTCESIANFYRFDKIDTPVIEDTELFSKGIGSATEIVGKQMYSFRSRGGDYLTLRPEGTAPVMRAYIEHGMINLPQPIKLWYFCPFFRYEKPQAGRYRQFWQFGFEVIGEGSPVIDAQIIQIFYNILNELKFKNLIVEINSIGDNQCRPYYKKLLVSYFRSRESALCADCRRRLRENPLRILDCKEEKCQRLISQAPQMIDHLCEECHAHFKEVLEFLDEIGLPYRLNPHLVRGLDYYTKTVFEIFEEEEHFREKMLADLMVLNLDAEAALRQVLIKSFESVANSKIFIKMYEPGVHEQLLRKLPAEKMRHHQENDLQAGIDFVRHFQYNSNLRKLKPEVIIAFFRAIFTVTFHRNEIGPDVYTEVIDLLVDVVAKGLVE